MCKEAQSGAKNSFTASASGGVANIHAYNVFCFVLGSAVASKGLGGLKSVLTRGSSGDTYITHMYVEDMVSDQGSTVVPGLTEEEGMHDICPSWVKNHGKPECLALACGSA